MSGCPDEECKRKLETLAKFVWGKEGDVDGGLTGKIQQVRDCAKKNVPKTWLAIFVLSFGIALFTSGYRLYHGVQAAEAVTTRNEKMIQQNAQTVKELAQLVYQNRIDQTKCQTQMENIHDSLKEIKGLIKKGNGG